MDLKRQYLLRPLLPSTEDRVAEIRVSRGLCLSVLRSGGSRFVGFVLPPLSEYVQSCV